jgi:UDP-N-acetylmuramyl pentapeptide phosphotransferase/UDP-N-acetylglucosamine-1-phosphate transferase
MQLVSGFVASLMFCILLVLTKSWHGVLSMDANEGIQKFHSTPTPRIGGLAIVAALCVAWLFAPADLKSLIGKFLLAGLPAFIFGLAEDLTEKSECAAAVACHHGVWVVGLVANRLLPLPGWTCGDLTTYFLYFGVSIVHKLCCRRCGQQHQHH